MKLRKMVVSALATASLLSLSVTGVYAAEPVAETSEYAVNSVVVSTDSSVQFEKSFSTLSTLEGFSYTNLSNVDGRNKVYTDNFDLRSSGNVSVKLYQYPSNGSGTATVRYTLQPAEKDSKAVTGNYSSYTNTITFKNVNSGTYYLIIENIGNTIVSGSGTISD